MSDKRLLKLIRVFLQAGVMEGGLVNPVDEGTPQGGPPYTGELMSKEGRSKQVTPLGITKSTGNRAKFSTGIKPVYPSGLGHFETV